MYDMNYYRFLSHLDVLLKSYDELLGEKYYWLFLTPKFMDDAVKFIGAFGKASKPDAKCETAYKNVKWEVLNKQ